MDIVKRLKAKPPKGFVTSPLMIDAADEIEQLREENQRQKEKIMLLNSMVQTEHEIIRVATRKEGE